MEEFNYWQWIGRRIIYNWGFQRYGKKDGLLIDDNI